MGPLCANALAQLNIIAASKKKIFAFIVLDIL
jgi:hypothetical protein